MNPNTEKMCCFLIISIDNIFYFKIQYLLRKLMEGELYIFDVII